jgi:hypothetical protein
MWKNAPERRNVMPSEPWFRDDKEFLPLQAADLSAGLIRFSLNSTLEIGRDIGSVATTFKGVELECRIGRSLLFDKHKLTTMRPAIHKAVIDKLKAEADDDNRDG